MSLKQKCKSECTKFNMCVVCTKAPTLTILTPPPPFSPYIPHHLFGSVRLFLHSPILIIGNIFPQNESCFQHFGTKQKKKEKLHSGFCQLACAHAHSLRKTWDWFQSHREENFKKLTNGIRISCSETLFKLRVQLKCLPLDGESFCVWVITDFSLLISKHLQVF